MEIEFFCHPDTSHEWYQYWRDRRYPVVRRPGPGRRAAAAARPRPGRTEPLLDAARPTSSTPFRSCPTGEFGELEGIAHRGDFDLRSHMEGKLDPNSDARWRSRRTSTASRRHRGSGKDLTYRDDMTKRAVHAARDRAVGRCRSGDAGVPLRGLQEDEAPDEKGKMQNADGDEVPSRGWRRSRRPSSRWSRRTACPRSPRRSTAR